MFIKDIFYSFQGEGPFVGYPQVFIRFYGCNIHCAYCDEPDFSKDKKKYSVPDVLDAIIPFKNKPLHSISITGGEPLMYADALKELVPQLPAPAYLETNGTLTHKLKSVKSLFRFFSVDYKPGYHAEFASFIAELQHHPGCFVKFILLHGFNPNDLHNAGKLVQQYNPNMPFIIQPVTPFASITKKPTPSEIESAHAIVSTYLSDVRVIGQTHKLIAVK
jgi:organic radical activating enzyme